MKVFIIAIVALMFSGCGIYDKTKIVFTCVDNVLYATVYQAQFTSKGENIVSDENRVRINELISEKGITIFCQNEVKDEK